MPRYEQNAFYYVYIKDILAVETNIKDFKWMYGKMPLHASKEEFEKCKVKVYIAVKKDADVFCNKDMEQMQRQIHYFYGMHGCDSLFYDRSFILGKKLRYSIKVRDNTITCVVGETYFKYIHGRIMNLHAIEYILSDMATGLLLLNGFSTLYCSAVDFGNSKKGSIFFAFPGAGKTVTATALCEHKNIHFMAEDVALYDGENIFAVPLTASYRERVEKKSFFAKAINKILRPFLSFADPRKAKNDFIERMFRENRITHRQELKNAFILERGDNSGDGDASQKVHLLNRYLLKYHTSPALIAFNYFNDSFSLEEMEQREKCLLKKIAENVNVLYLTKRNPVEYADEVLRVLDSDIKKD